MYKSSYSGVLLGKDVLQICSKFTGEHGSAISIKFLMQLATSLKSPFGMGVLL